MARKVAVTVNFTHTNEMKCNAFIYIRTHIHPQYTERAKTKERENNNTQDRMLSKYTTNSTN